MDEACKILDDIFRASLEQLYKHGSAAALKETQRRPYELDELVGFPPELVDALAGHDNNHDSPDAILPEYIAMLSNDHMELARIKIDMIKAVALLDLDMSNEIVTTLQNILARLSASELINLDDAERFMNAAICVEGHSSFNTCRLQIQMIHRLADANEWKRAQNWVRQVDVEHLSPIIKASFDRLASRVAQHV